ncbi:MAG: radical SAM protein [Candidatus Aenigmarchaeota archaeon]|nr:radical SAM protein [Candidatus Aenigmarchaeota archaeon]
MKVMLLNPPAQVKVSKDSRWPEYTKSGTLYYPFWLAYATSVLMEDKRHKPLLLDSIAKEIDFEETIKMAKKFGPDLLVVDTSTPTIYKDVEFVEMLKKEIPDVKVMLAGRHVTALPTESLKMSPAIDMVARQEFDYTVLDVANTLENGGHLKDVTGISFKENGEVIHNAPRMLEQNLDKIPFVSKAYKEFLDVKDYRYALAKYPMLQIWSSRGCPAHCTFCDYPQVFTMHTFRMRSPKNVVDEMQWIHENLPNVKEIFLEDDTFTINRERVLEICKLIKERGLELTWSCNARANLDYELLKVMHDAGARIMIVGYESGNQNVLNKIKKGILISQAGKFTRAAQKAGLKIFGCFMIGLPGDTEESVWETFQHARRMNPDMVFFQQAVPFPGTEFYAWAKANGYLITEDYRQWLDENGRLRCLVNYPWLPAEKIDQLRETLMVKYYFNPKHMFYTLMRNLHPHEFIRVVRYARDYLTYLLTKKFSGGSVSVEAPALQDVKGQFL